jgi:Family of unknown function (DUF6270)
MGRKEKTTGCERRPGGRTSTFAIHSKSAAAAPSSGGGVKSLTRGRASRLGGGRSVGVLAAGADTYKRVRAVQADVALPLGQRNFHRTCIAPPLAAQLLSAKPYSLQDVPCRPSPGSGHDLLRHVPSFVYICVSLLSVKELVAELVTYGGCVTRDTFENIKEDHKLLAYVSRQSLITASSRPTKLLTPLPPSTGFEARNFNGDISSALYGTLEQLRRLGGPCSPLAWSWNVSACCVWQTTPS